jgi:catechol 2,3-dioxygenase-like lactoylglutathione lyase family enzyme
MMDTPRWTHVAIPVSDLDRSVDFYTSFTPLVLVARFDDESGHTAWLSNEGQVTDPFVLVLTQFTPAGGAGFGASSDQSAATLAPFAHLGIELPSRADVDAMADRARALGVLHWEPRQLAEHVGYVCAAVDPDGNVVEFSWDQRVYATVRERWGTRR